jgi:GABA(A) receptor-associated protein
MNTTNSYSVPGILQPSFASQQPYTEMTTQTVHIHASAASAASAPATTTGGSLTNDQLERIKKSQTILEKYPDRVPLIIQPSKSDRDAYPIDKSKYITPRELTLLQLQQIIRKRVHFPAEKALFMFINNRIYPITSMIGTIYDANKDADGFLYVSYCQESTFGGCACNDI